MKYHKILLSLFLLCAQSVQLVADTITVHNETDDDMFIALYYQQSLVTKSDAQLVTGPVSLTTDAPVGIERPGRKIGYDRVLAFAASASDLKPSMNAQEFKMLAQTNVGDIQGTTVYIALDDDGFLQGYNTVEWTAQRLILSEFTQIKGAVSKQMRNGLYQLTKSFSAIKDNPYKDSVAQVRAGNQLHPDERAYLGKRVPKVKSALETFLGHPIDQVPTIALVESGGGFRAMTCSIGWHMGAAAIGLMDAVTYMVGLSGSTWSIGLWTMSGKSIADFKNQTAPMLQQGLDIAPTNFPNELKLIMNNFLIKSSCGQDVTMVDFYGALLANALLKYFGDARQQTYLSQQVQKIANGDWPFPIYTAVRGDPKAKQDWYEFTPYEVGAPWLGKDNTGLYVPTWAYGREFDNGQSIKGDFAPEQSFGYLMGTFGSAFSASIERILESVVKNPDTLLEPLKTFAQAIMNEIGHKRITTAVIHNFTDSMPNSTIKDLEKLRLIDAGIEFNLPYPPVSGERPERTADILIFLDASAGRMGAELTKVEKYARERKLKFPKIDYATIDSKVVSIFKDEQDASVPLVIYMPRINDPALLDGMKNTIEFALFMPMIKGFDVQACIAKDFCSTFNFKYAVQEFLRLSALTEFNMRASKTIIRDAIEWKVAQMSGKKVVVQPSPSPVFQGIPGFNQLNQPMFKIDFNLPRMMR